MKTKKIVKFRKSLKLALSQEKLIADIIEDVKSQIVEINLNAHKHDLEMLLDICNCVEDSIKSAKKGKKKINKKDIVLKVYAELYADIDLNVVDSAIETLFDNKMIKKSSYMRLIFKFVTNFFLNV